MQPVQPRKLLIVEDEPTIASDLSLILRKLGYAVVGTVDNGTEAVRQAAALLPDLVLMDVQLKDDMDGTEAARQIRVTSGRPVIFLTGHSDASVLKRAKETEPYGYILKPFTARELMVQVEMALYRHQMENERAQLKHELEIAHENLRTLRGLLPLCAGCKKIREDDGYWSKLEDYFAAHANVEFTHGFCPDCENHFYGTRPGRGTVPLVVERKKNPRQNAAG
jgi:AmiR/NasT family two-component response regulator